jgi:hypothetical protein
MSRERARAHTDGTGHETEEFAWALRVWRGVRCASCCGCQRTVTAVVRALWIGCYQKLLRDAQLQLKGLLQLGRQLPHAAHTRVDAGVPLPQRLLELPSVEGERRRLLERVAQVIVVRISRRS